METTIPDLIFSVFAGSILAVFILACVWICAIPKRVDPLEETESNMINCPKECCCRETCSDLLKRDRHYSEK